MGVDVELSLPDDLRRAACRSDNEWGWPPDLIPRVITEAEKLHLLNVGGQLQFLLPSGTCECYWVDVDPLSSAPEGLTWDERVAHAARNSLSEFERVRAKFDFVAEGRTAFREHFARFEASGGDLAEVTCFIWYLEAAEEGDN